MSTNWWPLIFPKVDALPMTKEEIIFRRLEGLHLYIHHEIQEMLLHCPLLKVGAINFDKDIA